MNSKIVLIIVGLLLLCCCCTVVSAIALYANRENLRFNQPDLSFITQTPVKPNIAKDGCISGGCSGQLCIEANTPDQGFSTCEYRQEYACVVYSSCERQASGKCGWTKTPLYISCMAASQENLPD